MSDQTTAVGVAGTVVGTYSVLRFDGALEYLVWGIFITLAGWVIYKVAQWWGSAAEEEKEEEKKPTAKAPKKAKAKPVEPPDPEEE